LTKELVDSQARSVLTQADSDDDDDDDDEVSGDAAVAGTSSHAEAAARAWLASDVTWKPGDKCRAIWSENHQYVHSCFFFFICSACITSNQLVLMLII